MNYVERFLAKFHGVREDGEGRWKALCPAHEDSSPSLGISLGVDGRILFNCLTGCDAHKVRKAAGFEFSELWCPDGEVAIRGEVASSVKLPTLPEPKWHDVYAAFLQKLILTPEHREALLGRGLTEDDIDRGEYRTLGWLQASKAVMELEWGMGRETLLLTPGFRSNPLTSKIEIAVEPGGLVIPVRSQEGKILALKIRQDGNPKYVWFSGGGSPSCGSPAHCGIGWEWGELGASPTVRVVEGPLKADVVGLLAEDIPTIGIGGVSNWKGALSLLKALGASTVHVALDSDWKVKEGVASALGAFCAALEGAGFKVMVEDWHPNAGKGPDDALLNRATLHSLSLATVLPDIVRISKGWEEREIILPSIAPTEVPKTKGPVVRDSKVQRASEVGMGRVEWLWEGWLPKGSLVLLEGEPAGGKGLFAMDLLAKITTGRLMPEEKRSPRLPANVLVLSSEDSKKNTLNPRLKAAGADLSKVLYYTPPLVLPQGLADLKEVVERYAIEVVMFDPLNAYLDPSIDTNSDVALRQALSQVSSWLEASGCVVLGVRHFNKATSQKGIHRGLGSVAYGAQSRVEMAVVADPDVQGRRILVQIKNNLAAKPSGLAYWVIETPVTSDDGVSSLVPKVDWEGPVEGTVDELLKGSKEPIGKVEACGSLLLSLLEESRPAKEVDRLCREAGYSGGTIDRAKAKFKVKSRLEYPSNGMGERHWRWYLEDKTDGKDLHTK